MQIKTLFNRENLVYTISFTILLIVIVANRIYYGFNNIVWLTDIASIFTVMGAIFLAKHSIIGPICLLISNLLTIPVTLVQSVWLNAIINICIMVPFWALSIIRWHKSNKTNQLFISSLNKKQIIITISIIIPVIVLVAFILHLCNGNLFYLDAIYSVLCASAAIFSSFALIEQFYLFLGSNIFGIIMYSLLTIQNINNFSSVLVCITLFIINILSILNWRKILKNKQNSTTTNIEQKEKGLI